MVDKLKYVKWFKIAREVLGPDLVGELKKDEDIATWVSPEDWLVLPLPTEPNMNAVKNRRVPNIYMIIKYPPTLERLLDHGASDAEVIPGKIKIGLTCNTLEAVKTMRNILDGFHNPERENLLSALKCLDDSFEASVSTKKKTMFRSIPEYGLEFTGKSNKIDETCIRKIFENVDEVRNRGLQLMRERGKHYPVEAPVFELAGCEFLMVAQTFREKLQALKPVFEACLRIKSESEIKKAKKEMEDSRIAFACRRCGRNFSEEEYRKSKFCPICGGLILPK